MGCTYHPLGRENLDVHSKESEDSTNIVKSDTEEVDEGQISTVKK